MEVYTIGFTGRTARGFFDTLKEAGIERVIDVRLHNRSQLAGFTKASDLPYFLRAIGGIDYVHELRLAPTPEMLHAYRNKRGPWSDYEHAFHALLKERRVEVAIERGLFASPAVLLCSEPTAERCHRRIAAEYLQRHWGEDVAVRHL